MEQSIMHNYKFQLSEHSKHSWVFTVLFLSASLFYFLDVIREKGLEKVTVDMLVTEITPKARCKFTLY